MVTKKKTYRFTPETLSRIGRLKVLMEARTATAAIERALRMAETQLLAEQRRRRAQEVK